MRKDGAPFLLRASICACRVFFPGKDKDDEKDEKESGQAQSLSLAPRMLLLYAGNQVKMPRM